MELTIDQALQKAVEAHKAGQIQEADRLYTAILQAQPKHPDANHNLGVLAVSVGKLQEALPLLKTALEANPVIAQFWVSYIDALIRLDKLAEAKTVLDQAKRKGAKGDGFEALEQRLKSLADGPGGDTVKVQDPPQDQVQSLINLYHQGELQQALKQVEMLVQQFPQSTLLFTIQGAILKALGQLDLSVDAYKKAIAIEPDYAEAYNNMGASLQEQGQLDEAIAAYTQALAIQPDYAEAYSNMGNVLKAQGKLDEAIAAYTKAITIKPDYANAYYNLGNALQAQGTLEEAIAAYAQVIAIQPDYAEAYSNMGNALKAQGKLKEAIAAYTKALAIKPDYAEAYNNMGASLHEQGKLEEAIAAYTQALAVKPDYIDAWSNGAETLEKGNKLKRLDMWLEKAFKILTPVPANIKFMKAQLLWRNKDIQAASKLILNIDFESITPVRKSGFLNLKAKCYEASKDYDLAYSCFEKMNSYEIRSKDYSLLAAEKFFENIKKQLSIIASDGLKFEAGNIAKQTGLAPVFLVGFPRSGTTLLDTILRSHSSIDVVEEQYSVRMAEAFAVKSGYSVIGQELPEDILIGARKAYFSEVNKYREKTDKDAILIDKLPLNILEIPFIHHIFPQAKFILALRHPFDTILSCWMQNFKLNPAMANMVELDRIVEFYCIAMETFKICEAKYDLHVHQIKYEDLIEDLSGETSALLKFLDLEWEDHMKDYQLTALERGRINTPSYSQVVQPIYKDAKYRWLKYEKYLRKYTTQIKPWLDEFAYSDH